MSFLSEDIDSVFEKLQHALLDDEPSWDEVNEASRDLLPIISQVAVLETRLSHYRRTIQQLGGSVCEECGLAFPDTNNFGFCSEDCRKKHCE